MGRILYIIIRTEVFFSLAAKEKQKRLKKVLTKKEKGGILTKLSREGQGGSGKPVRSFEKSS